MDPVGPGEGGGAGKGTVLISDVMGRDKSINIFAGLVRDVAFISQRLDSEKVNSTVLAPLNSAVEGMPGKPWEDRGEYSALGAGAYEGDEGRERAKRNIERFVKAHVVPSSPWKENVRVKSLLEDGEIWWERKGEGMLLQPDGIEIQSVASKVGNGEVWIIKSVRNLS